LPVEEHPDLGASLSGLLLINQRAQCFPPWVDFPIITVACDFVAIATAPVTNANAIGLAQGFQRQSGQSGLTGGLRQIQIVVCSDAQPFPIVWWYRPEACLEVNFGEILFVQFDA
jgi:hypothetical protein